MFSRAQIWDRNCEQIINSFHLRSYHGEWGFGAGSRDQCKKLIKLPRKRRVRTKLGNPWRGFLKNPYKSFQVPAYGPVVMVGARGGRARSRCCYLWNPVWEVKNRSTVVSQPNFFVLLVIAGHSGGRSVGEWCWKLADESPFPARRTKGDY